MVPPVPVVIKLAQDLSSQPHIATTTTTILRSNKCFTKLHEYYLLFILLVLSLEK